MRDEARNAGFRIPTSWNLSGILSASKGLAIRTPNGWEITRPGKEKISTIIGDTTNTAAAKPAIELRTELVRIADADTKQFVEEAIACFEHKLYRSAIVMSWLAAMHVLYLHIIANELSSFNSEAARVDSRWKNAKTVDDLARMKERDFLERLAAISVIGKNTKKDLIDCLDRRNACGHPNSAKYGQNTVAHHLEVLLLNVFKKF